MSIAGKRALITGINGFTGRFMANELAAQGCEVLGVGSQPSDSPSYYQVDLADVAGLRKLLADTQPDIVVHLAALAFVGHGAADAFYQVNLIGTRNLLEAIDACGKVPDCVLLASSANVYGNASSGMLDETTQPAPANDYAVSKLAMEYMASLWHAKLPIVIARPFNYTGVGQAENFLLPKIVSHFTRKASTIELGNLDVWRDFSDVRAVVSAYRGLLEARPLGQTINVSSGVTYSLREVIDMCREITGQDIDVQVNPAFVRANEVKTLCGNNARLRALVHDWQTPPLRETLSWMLPSA
ncbi:GDP-mannose 4,6-dehydratase [Pseudomonas savastanoi pv. phaseolicola]|uniref:Dependent epimerase/dehydratase protein n=4 Tax=Pseudomonas savastanoi TaxID=29438 RepID=A0A0P9QWL8_PSESG|nr:MULTISPECIES: GDP-mannose 4,6-dehydratase [Pseudomonas]KPB87691.1 NAD dependent epimerase/dehydratase family protein [Pseudomonas syringae pv. maculicola]AAZ34081.1 NAD dependent epimerase/dehydratase family protein [Pseudomonas savastanoi pv. phaseolicola 1448A]EFW81926.1 NAD dependent epimerase/dehydratase family protein [Pseudomonas savastanoi pv. glycinea str. B076]EFW86301.1 NAD dependent epimerase/dehydratase family protein [Pseudomonas savastanoi pv. glycinea str. race 4]EGH16386.1 N